MDKKVCAFYDGRIEELVKILPEYFYPEEIPLQILATTSNDEIPFSEIDNCTFKTMKEGDIWGEAWCSAWFKLTATVPKNWHGKRVIARLNFEGEGCIFSEQGEPLQGLTNGSVFVDGNTRERFDLFTKCQGGEDVKLLVEGASNSLFGVFTDALPLPKSKNFKEHYNAKILCARLSVFDTEIYNCWLDLFFLQRLLADLDEKSVLRPLLRNRLTQVANLFDYSNPASKITEMRQIMAPILQMQSGDEHITSVAIGHAHIDTAWLWPVRETIRKCGRTFANQLQLIKKYPEYTFGASQPQHYQFVKERYPALYKKIKTAVAEGRWELQGGMWVEPDTNIPTGESLVRQLLYGKKFFKDEFGINVRNLWLPDVFGYSAVLPQLLQSAGIDSFLTQKISWNQFTRFPYHTFHWVGLDGSKILSHFPPEDTYNSQMDVARLRYAETNFEERGILPEFITLFGVGDGGGGPREEQIEDAIRMKNMAGCPKVRLDSAQSLFDKLHKHADKLPTWIGELYMEGHRGTLTTQAKNKKMNRLCEQTLRFTEMLCSCLPLPLYPSTTLEQIWKTVLKNQFHDIIPGSSVTEVYKVSLQEYEQIIQQLQTIIENAVTQLQENNPNQQQLTIINNLSHDYNNIIYLNKQQATITDAQEWDALPVQPDNDGGVWIPITCKANSATPAKDAIITNIPNKQITATTNILENQLIRYEFQQGTITRIYDKQLKQEFMPTASKGNLLSLYTDWPKAWDAWDVDITYENQLLENATLTNSKITNQGVLFAQLELNWKFSNSSLKQKIRLSAFSKRLDFICHCNWNECKKMLRVSFPTTINSLEANYEIQYGIYQRPTHRNTTTDMAKFEVCGHTFADLSNKNYGVALLNNCKYGYKIFNSTLDLNLLRSPYNPDPTADQGKHQFTYSILPHNNTLDNSTVLAEAHHLNSPPKPVDGLIKYNLPIKLTQGNAILDWIKKAEDQDAWIARIYEPLGYHCNCTLQLADKNYKAFSSNIIEEKGTQLNTKDNQLNLNLKPFQVQTILIYP